MCVCVCVCVLCTFQWFKGSGRRGQGLCWYTFFGVTAGRRGQGLCWYTLSGSLLVGVVRVSVGTLCRGHCW